jgi:ABC-type transport system involved in multi-copper enzyme maturation permease subunit
VFTTFRPLFALFARSLREQSRTKFTPLARGGIALALLLFVALSERQFTNRSAPGQYVLMILAMVNFFAIAIFGLSTFASAITEEKEDDTLGLLRMTRLNPLSILLGKSTARLFEGFLLLAVQLPFTMLCITLGGVSQAQVLRCYAILAAFLFFLCNVALLWSVVCRRTSRATSMTTISGFALYLLPLFLFPISMVSRFSGKTTPTWYETFSQWSMAINPIFDLTRTITPRGSFPFAADSISVSLIGGSLCFGLAWLLFAPCCNADGEAVLKRPEKTTGSATRRRFAVPRPGRRAVAWKDFHFLGGGCRGLIIRSTVYLAISALLIWWMAVVGRGTIKREAVGVGLWVFGLMAFTVEVGLVSVRLFGIERKRNTLGSLYTLPIGTSRLIGEKVLGALPTFIPSVGLLTAGWLIAGQQWRPSATDLARYILFGSQYLFFAVLAMYLSLRMRRAALASAIALMFVGNIVLSSFEPGYRADNKEAYLLTMALLSGIGTIGIAARIPSRLGIAAAAE